MAIVVLINPPSTTVGKNSTRRLSRVLYPSPPYGLASIAAVLEQRGHIVRIMDMVQSPLSENGLLDFVQICDADWVGISILGQALYSAQSIASKLRKRFPDLNIVAGNALASEYPEWCSIQIPELDAVVVGEGEMAFASLVETGVRGTIPGVYGCAGKTFNPPVQIKDLDSLPMPAWHLLPTKSYRSSPQLMLGSRPWIPLLQSRGCPWQCGFCAQNFAWSSVQFRSMNLIAEEIKRGYMDFGITDFGFIDSIFPIKKEFGEQLYSELEKVKLLGKIRFGLETRVDLVWQETFGWLKKAGLHMAMLGIETGSPDLLVSQNKTNSVYPTEKATRTLADLGIRAYGLFVIGFPEESEDHRLHTEKMMMELPLDMASVGLYAQYAGSPDVRSQKDVDPISLMEVNFGGAKHSDNLVRWQGRLMRSFFLRPRIIIKHLLRRDIPLHRLVLGGTLLLADLILSRFGMIKQAREY